MSHMLRWETGLKIDWMARRRHTIVLLLALFMSLFCLWTIPPCVTTAAAEETLTVLASIDRGPIDAGRGFLHGADEQTVVPPDSALTAALHPDDWRLFKIATLVEAQRHASSITFGISNPYAWHMGGWPHAKPWLDWAGFEQYIANYVYQLQLYFPEYEIDYWDIWNEPDHSYFWRGTYGQLLETFARAAAAIRSVHPDARLVGPSISWLRQNGSGVDNVIDFLVDLDELYDLRLDAISWHENGGAFHGGPKPEAVLDDTVWLRSQLAAHFPPSYQPELHINEYLGGREHLSPGWNVGYLYYLGEAQVDASNRACWGVYSEEEAGGERRDEYWSDCWAGLNGMFMRDNVTPQLAYWTNKAHADMAGGRWLLATSTESTTNVIASRHDDTQIMRLLVGRHFVMTPADVTIRVIDYPFAADGDSVRVEIQRLPNFTEFYTEPPKAIPWPQGPLAAGTRVLPVTGGDFQLTLEGFAEGEAYILHVETVTSTVEIGMGAPAVTRPRLSRPRPNPSGAGTEIRYALGRAAPVRLEIFDALGRAVVTLVQGTAGPGQHTIRWDGQTDAGRMAGAGIYFVRLEAGTEISVRKLIRLK